MDQINSAHTNAEKRISKITSEVIDIEGYTGIKMLHFFNNLLDMNDSRFLEIGTWKGSITSAAMCENASDIVCIDNWCQTNYCETNRNGDIYQSRKKFSKNLAKFTGRNNVTFTESDWEKVYSDTISKRNIYFYDANYPLSEHRKCLQHFLPILDNIFIYIVGDWDFSDVRNGIRGMINDLQLEVLYEKKIYNKNHEKQSQLTIEEQILTKSTYNSKLYHEFMKNNWWYGLCILILKKN